MLVSVTEDWNDASATARLFDRAEGATHWKPRGWKMTASVGREGLAWGRGLHATPVEGPRKREGDGRSPAGVFDLLLATGYEEKPPSGTHLPYRRATETLRCVDDPKSRHYNRLVDEAIVEKDWRSAEDMLRPDELYRLVIVVGHNEPPVVAGAGSCIFLHLRRDESDVTAGCTALDEGRMKDLLRRLDPKMRPVLVQLPRAEYERLRLAWGLPSLR